MARKVVSQTTDSVVRSPAASASATASAPTTPTNSTNGRSACVSRVRSTHAAVPSNASPAVPITARKTISVSTISRHPVS
ncbi:MAG: hypothetical protein BRD23_03870 [Halobacteriales archaeon SW_9_67_25]|nr:MAG: hypothetical protein BRD23_03870 [Halobacteriales archaeon SW_9_67_25]